MLVIVLMAILKKTNREQSKSERNMSNAPPKPNLHPLASKGGAFVSKLWLVFTKKESFVCRTKGSFSMRSVPCGTGDLLLKKTTFVCRTKVAQLVKKVFLTSCAVFQTFKKV
jgi:hypothetical protein